LARDHGLGAVPVICGAASAFRHRARLAIRGRLGTPKLGLFELASHRVAHIPTCIVHHPLINRVAAVVRRALVDARVTCYSDKAHLGLARYLQVVVERRSQTAQVVLVGNCSSPEPLAGCLELIRERLGAQLHSLWFNAQCERTNTILGPEFHCWWGPESVIEEFGGCEVHYPPGAFGQNNLEIAERIIEAVRTEIPPGARVAEFYAGVGAIGLSVLERAAEIRMNELGVHSLRGLELGLAGLDSADRAKITLIPGSAGNARSAVDAADVVVADPPRKGMDAELCDYLTNHPPARILYISCGLESFLDDVARLTSGRLKLTALTAFNLLPFTEHVETLARFERV
jgi:tRNA/tmRNA/rRNA uracil-C5-methylase (TrmA/RlmC/RlmD family)